MHKLQNIIVPKKYKVNDLVKLIFLIIFDVFINFIKKSQNTIPAEVNSILLIRLDNLGDILLTRPLLYSLHDSFPGNDVDLLVANPSFGFLFNEPWIHIYIKTRSILKGLKLKKYDLIIEPKGRLDYAFLSWWLKPKFSIGFGDAGGGSFFDISLYQVDQNPIEKNKQICRALNIVYKDEYPEIIIEDRLINQYRKYSNCILIMPYSSKSEKDWLIENYIKVANHFKVHNLQVIFGGESYRKIDFDFIKKAGYIVELFESSQLTNLVALIKSVKLLIGSDSAPIHIAAAEKTNSLAIFLKENPLIWHPYMEIDGHYYIDARSEDLALDKLINKVELILDKDEKKSKYKK